MSNCVRSTTVCNSLIPVNRIVYGGKKLLNDSVSEVDPEVYLVMKNVNFIKLFLIILNFKFG